jgi:hypothetical protein
MIDFGKLLGIAAQLNVPGLMQQGIAFVEEVKANATKAKEVLSDGDIAELDQIHADALAAADRLDAKLAAAEKR